MVVFQNDYNIAIQYFESAFQISEGLNVFLVSAGEFAWCDVV
jgi:hypothetical protein